MGGGLRPISDLQAQISFAKSFSCLSPEIQTLLLRLELANEELNLRAGSRCHPLPGIAKRISGPAPNQPRATQEPVYVRFVLQAADHRRPFSLFGRLLEKEA